MTIFGGVVPCFSFCTSLVVRLVRRVALGSFVLAMGEIDDMGRSGYVLSGTASFLYPRVKFVQLEASCPWLGSVLL